MKKIIVILGLGLMLSACGVNHEGQLSITEGSTLDLVNEAGQSVKFTEGLMNINVTEPMGADSLNVELSQGDKLANLKIKKSLKTSEEGFEVAGSDIGQNISKISGEYLKGASSLANNSCLDDVKAYEIRFYDVKQNITAQFNATYKEGNNTSCR